MSDQTIHLFLHDPIFVDRTQVFRDAFGTGGVGLLTAQALSYFKTPYQITDDRETRLPAPFFGTATRPSLLLDQAVYGEFITLLQAAPVDKRNGLFAIIDRLAYHLSPSDTVDSLEYEMHIGGLYPGLVKKSIELAAVKASGTAYHDSGSETIQVPESVRFLLDLPQGSDSVRFEIKVWTSNASFLAGYAPSVILAAVPPLDYTDLLSAALTGLGANLFTTAMTVAQLTQSALAVPIAAEDASGVYLYKAKFYDTTGNMVQVPFQILYVGREPDRVAIRQAIKQQVLSSGVGTEAQWRARCPELFIDARFYAVALWNNRTIRADQSVIHPSVVSYAKTEAWVRQALPHLDSDFIHDNMEILHSPYDTLTIAIVPHPLNDASKLSFRALHPSYLDFAPSDVNFNYMTAGTREMATRLNDVLAIAAGKATSPLYTLNRDDVVFYYPFDAGFIEYAVQTQENYFNLVGMNP